MSNQGCWLAIHDLEALAAELPPAERTQLWQWALEHPGKRGDAAAWQQGQRRSIEQQATALRELFRQGAEDTPEREQRFRAGVQWLREQEQQYGASTCLADQLCQAVGALHDWLVNQNSGGERRADWFWQGWELLQWRQGMKTPLPDWWPVVKEQLVRYGALAWRDEAEGLDAATSQGQEAICRTLRLLAELTALYEPLPEWIPQLQRQLLQKGLAHLLSGPPWERSDDLTTWLRYEASLSGAQQQKACSRTKEGQETQLLAVLSTAQKAMAAAGQAQLAQAIQQRREALQCWETTRLQVCETLHRSEWQAAQILIRQWIAGSEGSIPTGVDEEIWSSLMLNACANSDQNLPRVWLVESRSLPRSGHHFLKSLLAAAWGKNFSYCEGYQEPGCCKDSPCSVAAYWHFAREHKKPHLRLLKSHDFSMTDSTFDPPPGMIRLIQVRRPFNLLVSWLELEQLAQNRDILKGSSIVLERIFLYHEPEVLEEAWRLIDQGGVVMSDVQVQQWLDAKVRYMVNFLHKWLPLVRPFSLGDRLQGGNVLMRYEDLGHGQQLLQALGRDDLNAQELPTFSPRHQCHQQVMKRRATRVTELIQSNREILLQADSAAMAAVPAMRKLYPQPICH